MYAFVLSNEARRNFRTSSGFTPLSFDTPATSSSTDLKTWPTVSPPALGGEVVADADLRLAQGRPECQTIAGRTREIARGGTIDARRRGRAAARWRAARG